MVFELILAATVLVSLISFAGLFFIQFNQKRQEMFLFIFVSIAAGTFFAAAFFDLLPEALGQLDAATVLPTVLAGILSFFVIEKLILWHHHHDVHAKTTERPFGYLNLIGDGIHNFLDGAAIAASFMASVHLGLVTTLVIIAHEIPQEISDFTLLIYSGFSKKKALLFNFVVALTAVLGSALFYFFAAAVQNMVPLALAFTAGAFIYIACADLLPELHKEKNMKKSTVQFVLIIAGIALIWSVITFFE